MRLSAHPAAFDGATARRLVLAVAASAAFHAIVIGALRAGAPNLAQHSVARIEARIAAADRSESIEMLNGPPSLDADTVASDETSSSAQTNATGQARAREPIAAASGEAKPALDPALMRPPVASLAMKPSLDPAATTAAGPAAAVASANTVSATEARAVQDAAPAAGAAKHAARAAQLPFAPDTTYYTIAALDRLPAPLVAPDACYPQGATGEVTYELLIDETGVVNQASVLEASAEDLATAAAVERCSAIRFSPAIKSGRNVRSKVRFVVGRS